MEEIEKDLLPAKEAMAKLQCGRTQLWKLAKEGKIVVYRLTERSVFYSLASIRAYLASCRVNPKI